MQGVRRSCAVREVLGLFFAALIAHADVSTLERSCTPLVHGFLRMCLRAQQTGLFSGACSFASCPSKADQRELNPLLVWV